MMGRLITLPFRLVEFIVSFVVIGAAVELGGLYFYLKWTTEVTFETRMNNLLADGVTSAEVVGFLTATPDRVVVVAFLVVVSLFLVQNRRWTILLKVIGGGEGGGGGDGGGGE